MNGMIIEGGLALLEALVGAVVENLPLILETGATIIGELISGISTASPGVQAIIATAVLPHILKIIDVIGDIGGAFNSVADLITGGEGLKKFSGLWETLKKGFSTVSTVVQTVMGGIGTVVSGLIAMVSNGITTIMGIGSKLMGSIKALFALIAANPVIAIVTGIIAAVVLLYTKCEWFRDAVHAVIDAVVGFFKGAWEAVQAAWSAAGEFFGGGVEGIKSVFDSMGEFLGGLFSDAWAAVQDAWGAAKEFFGDLWSNIKEKAGDAASNIKDKLKEAWNGIKSAWDNAKTFFGGLWSNIKEKGGEAAGKVKNAFGKAWDGIKSVWGGAMDFFGGIWEDIKGVFGNAWESFKSIGSNMLEGLWNGIGDKIEWLKSKVTGVVDIIKGWFTGKDGFEWSKTVFYRVMQGGVNGLDDGEDLLMREGNPISDKVKNGLNFGTTSVGVNASYSGAARYGAQETAGRPGNGWGNTTVNIYSPEAVDGVQAARVWRKETQKMAIAYI